ncbi:Putative uncharacterized protein [Moritella viscosa]|uniref:hypothetical protein n=1 Tax=Moritella viscosa TaxID=80854 RepID=UPI000508FB6A|nr:hypothetical protein [Moritella viscosa]CED59705.1 putative uncharacterized protein [Moritella viscosa]SHO02856.1 Putative uncharacterized protein [Moritella viscosa]SHO20843.1 Putative uncharacterized protein [Moritella viscosa]
MLQKKFPALDAISTRHLNSMPEVLELKKLLQSLAMLDAIMSPEWDERFYSFNSKWDDNEKMGSMKNGCGDDFSVLFNKAGFFVKGFDHKSVISSWSTDGQLPWPDLLKGLPPEFLPASKEPAFSMDSISFCIWKLHSADSWDRGDFEFVDDEDPDGSEYLLEIFDRNPDTYRVFAQEYYEVDLEVAVIEKIYNNLPLTDELVKEINPEVSLKQLEKDISEIGYPCVNAT